MTSRRSARTCIHIAAVLAIAAMTLAGAASSVSIAFAASAASLGELFQRGKDEFKSAAYAASLATFETLDAESSKPGNEQERAKLSGIVSFYKGINLVALGRDADGRAELRDFLAGNPAAGLDPSAYPKAVVKAFDEVKREVAAGVRSGGFSAELARFVPPPEPLPVDAEWSRGALRFLLTPAEKERWEDLGEDKLRHELVEEFWIRLDPDPATPRNETREELEKRVRFADNKFRDGKTRGSETDRGMVFVLLGPPSFVTETALRSEDDPVEMMRDAPSTSVSYNRGRRVVSSVPRPSRRPDLNQGRKESWVYRRDRLPAATRKQEVAIEFISREGYGEGVMQRPTTIEGEGRCPPLEARSKSDASHPTCHAPSGACVSAAALTLIDIRLGFTGSAGALAGSFFFLATDGRNIPASWAPSM